MKCRICKQATLPGARLCGPCRAALKRARHGGEAAVTDAEHEGAARPDAAARPGEPGVERTAALPTAGTRRMRRWPVIVMVGSALTAAAYVVPQRHPGIGPPDVREPSRSAAPSPADGIAPPAAAAAPRTGTTEAPRTDAVSVLAAPAAMHASENAPGSYTSTRMPELATPVRHRESPPVSPGNARRAMAPNVTRSPAPDAEGRGDAPVVARMAAGTRADHASGAVDPSAAADASQTRWQAMDDALAACQGGFFARFLCRQKTRIRFCEGYWGRVDPCATGAPGDAAR